ESVAQSSASEVNKHAIAANVAAVYPREILCGIPKKMTATQVGVARYKSESEDEYDSQTVFPRNPSFYGGGGRLTGKKRGDAYHKAMELIDFTRGDYTAQLQEMQARFTEMEYKAIEPAHILGFFDSALGRRAVAAERVVKEYKLYTEIEISALGIDAPALPADAPRPFIQGIADMFFYEGGEIVLVDYKTNRNTTADKLREDYGGQLGVYKKAIEEMTGVRVKECVLYSFEQGEILL
ncbi:MAG: PD-(D/E)XK nuclease family protein, partial [Oscillospiraceae bacterium]|nr:PD-(D/E)XK nuclease family protein [Oscillospiraceae bacterium]